MSQPHLIHPDYAEPIDPHTQVDRLPGIDAPCLCLTPPGTCLWPYCPWKHIKEDE